MITKPSLINERAPFCSSLLAFWFMFKLITQHFFHPLSHTMTHPVLSSNPYCHHPILKNLRSDTNTCILKDENLVNTSLTFFSHLYFMFCELFFCFMPHISIIFCLFVCFLDTSLLEFFPYFTH